eukprot:COSAG02_NODE_1901_length_10451_cov_44.668566_2_plen_105_part_00
MSICHSSVGSGKIMQSARTHETHPPTVLGAYFPPMYMDTTFFQISKKLPNLYISKPCFHDRFNRRQRLFFLIDAGLGFLCRCWLIVDARLCRCWLIIDTGLCWS